MSALGCAYYIVWLKRKDFMINLQFPYGLKVKVVQNSGYDQTNLRKQGGKNQSSSGSLLKLIRGEAFLNFRVKMKEKLLDLEFIEHLDEHL